MEQQNSSQIAVPVEGLQVDTMVSTDSTATTIYHIYHTGKGKRPPHYSIHSVRDSKTTILAPVKVKKTKEEKAKAKAEKKQAKADKKNLNNLSSSTTVLATSKSNDEGTVADLTTVNTDIATKAEDTPNKAPELKPLKGLKKLPKLDHPLHDPRVATAPYFLSLPKVSGKQPPYTLNYTGHKRGPVAALLTPSSFWSGWKLEFGDVLRQEGVVDGRGVVGIRYGVKGGKIKGEEGNFLRGFKLAKRRWWGENGKKYFNQQKSMGFPANEEVPIEEKARAEDVVKLKWVGLWKVGRVREYGFEWRGYKFSWKGTSQVVSKKGHGMWVWCNHLKLVVKLTEKGEEMELAKYCCVIGNRKAGRLEVDKGAMEGFLGQCGLSGGENGEEEKTRQRLQDIIVGTMICMLITERDKRRWLLEFLQEVGENAGG